MKFTSFVLILPTLGSAFHTKPGLVSQKRSCLSAVPIAKDKYVDNPLIYKVVDGSGEVKDIFNTEDVFMKAAEMDYSKMPLNDDQSDYHCVVQNLDRDLILAILGDYEKVGRFGSNRIIIDVRDPEDVDFTGKFSDHTINFPLSKMKEEHPFLTCHDDVEWLQKYGFEYPEVFEQFVILGKNEQQGTEAANYLKYNYYGNSKMFLYPGGADDLLMKEPLPDDEYEKAKAEYLKGYYEELENAGIKKRP